MTITREIASSLAQKWFNDIEINGNDWAAWEKITDELARELKKSWSKGFEAGRKDSNNDE